MRVEVHKQRTKRIEGAIHVDILRTNNQVDILMQIASACDIEIYWCRNLKVLDYCKA